jgi:hypothetical protein
MKENKKNIERCVTCNVNLCLPCRIESHGKSIVQLGSSLSKIGGAWKGLEGTLEGLSFNSPSPISMLLLGIFCR